MCTQIMQIRGYILAHELANASTDRLDVRLSGESLGPVGSRAIQLRSDDRAGPPV